MGLIALQTQPKIADQKTDLKKTVQNKGKLMINMKKIMKDIVQGSTK